MAAVPNILEFGLIAGIGYSITSKIDVDIRFAFGLTKLYDEDEMPAKSFMFHLGGTYRSRKGIIQLIERRPVRAV